MPGPASSSIPGVAAGTSVSLQTQGGLATCTAVEVAGMQGESIWSGWVWGNGNISIPAPPAPGFRDLGLWLVSCAYHQSGSTWGCNISTGQPVGTLYGFGVWAKAIVVPYIPGSRPIVNWTTGTGGNNLGWSAIVR